MRDIEHRNLFSLSTMSSGLLAASLTLPRVLGSNISFSFHSTTGLIFVGLLGISFLLSLLAIGYTAKHFRDLRVNQRIVGIVPFILVMMSAITVYLKS